MHGRGLLLVQRALPLCNVGFTLALFDRPKDDVHLLEGAPPCLRDQTGERICELRDEDKQCMNSQGKGTQTTNVDRRKHHEEFPVEVADHVRRHLRQDEV